MRPLAVGAQWIIGLMQHGWVRCELALRENAGHIVEQRQRLGAYSASVLW